MKRSLVSLLFAAMIPLPAMAFNPPGDDDPPDDPTDPPGDSACTNDSLTPGETTRTISVDGRSREYILHVPSSYDGNEEVPLMLDFHGLFTTAQYERNNSGTAGVSEDEGFIVAYPQGINNAWNFGPCCTRSRQVDDVAFAEAVVEEIKDEGCVDEKRVYATGMSNGGGISHYLACRSEDTFAAVAPAAFDLVEEASCNPSRPVSVFTDRGRQDSIVPYEGGRSTPPTLYQLDPIHFLGAQGTFERWGEINSCSGQPQDIGNGCQAYTDCDGGTEVVLCTHNGGHTFWDAEQSWDFLKDHTLP